MNLRAGTEELLSFSKRLSLCMATGALVLAVAPTYVSAAEAKSGKSNSSNEQAADTADESDTSDRYDTNTSGKSGSQTMNIRVSPLGLLVGYLNADLDIKMGDEWTLGPTLSYWSFKTDSSTTTGGIDLSMFAIGARANWYPSGVFKSGFFVSPIFQYVSATAKARSSVNGENISATASAPIFQGLAGYHWFGKTINFSLGAGFGVSPSSTKVKVTDSTGTSSNEVQASRSVGLALDMMLGYTF